MILSGEERPYHRDNYYADDEANQNQAGAAFYVVHEFVAARAEHQGAGRSAYRSCECAGCRNSDCHYNCSGVSTKLLSDCDTNRAQQLR